MKILYIITQADGGGAQNYVLALAKHFGGTIAAGNEAQELFTNAQKAGVPTVEQHHLKRRLRPIQDFLAAWEIRQLVKQIQPDIVHLNSTKAGILGSFACIGLKTQAVFTAHGFIFNEPMSWPKKAFYLAMEKTASAYRRHIIAVSDADKKSALRYGLMPENRISVIHNGIAPITFLPRIEARKNLGLPDDKLIVGAVANSYRTKGLDILIKAISMLTGDIKNRCQFALLGNGPETENLKLEIMNLQLQNIIAMPGRIQNASKYLSAFDIFVLPSRKEGFPFSILEAMQAGLPIVATNVGGTPEALGDAGLLVYPEDPQALAEAMEKLINSPTLREKLAQKALAQSKLFSQEKMLRETEKIYSNILAK